MSLSSSLVMVCDGRMSVAYDGGDDGRTHIIPHFADDKQKSRKWKMKWKKRNKLKVSPKKFPSHIVCTFLWISAWLHIHLQWSCKPSRISAPHHPTLSDRECLQFVEGGLRDGGLAGTWSRAPKIKFSNNSFWRKVLQRRHAESFPPLRYMMRMWNSMWMCVRWQPQNRTPPPIHICAGTFEFCSLIRRKMRNLIELNLVSFRARKGTLFEGFRGILLGGDILGSFSNSCRFSHGRTTRKMWIPDVVRRSKNVCCFPLLMFSSVPSPEPLSRWYATQCYNFNYCFTLPSTNLHLHPQMPAMGGEKVERH